MVNDLRNNYYQAIYEYEYEYSLINRTRQRKSRFERSHQRRTENVPKLLRAPSVRQLRFTACSAPIYHGSRPRSPLPPFSMRPLHYVLYNLRPLWTIHSLHYVLAWSAKTFQLPLDPKRLDDTRHTWRAAPAHASSVRQVLALPRVLQPSKRSWATDLSPPEDANERL